MKTFFRTHKLFNLLILLVLLTSTTLGSAVPFKAQSAQAAVPETEPVVSPAAPSATIWCAAGDFNSWNNSSNLMNDSGSNGDLFANDGIYSLEITVAAASRQEWKAVECSNWGYTVPGSSNSWYYTSTANQDVLLTLDTNDHSSDAGMQLLPAQNIVHAWAEIPASYTAVGSFQGVPWTYDDPTTLLTDLGFGIYRLEYTITTPGAYEAKVTATGSWGEQYAADGATTNGSNVNFTTTVADETVIFLVDTNHSRLTITPNGSGTGNWCLAGSINGWDNTSDPLYDDGTHGDLLGGDGIFSLDFTVSAAGKNEWKVSECNNWSVAYPTSNAWVQTGAADQVVKFTFDTNDHSNDAGMALQPVQYIVHAWDDLPASFNAVGPWQGWNPSDASTTLTSLGNNFYLLEYTFAAPGMYTGRLTNTGGWDDQYGADGRGVDAQNASFTVYKANDVAQFWLDGNQSRWAIITPPESGAEHDNNIWWNDLGHDSRDGLFRNPGGAVITGTLVTLRMQAADNDLTGVKLRLYNDRTNTESLVDMELAASDGEHEYWEYQFNVGVDPTIYWYRFIPMDGTAVAYYEDDAARTGGWGQPFAESQDNSWQLTVYDPAFQTPDWVKNAVVYQIFTDRFRDGDPDNDTPAGSFFYEETPTVVRSNNLLEDWNAPICDPRDAMSDCPEVYSQNFYGGDLQGIIDKLDYLENLGVTALYLNPIFESPSNHKYDTTDYSIIDDNFGDLALFQTLVSEAESHGIHIILDGVFNHTSSDSIYFDRYGRYDEVGACESATSPYRDWYYFTDVTPGTGECVGSDGTPEAATYESWFGYASLPKLNANSEAVRDLIWNSGTSSIAPYWIDQGAEGWRLDVAGDVDPGVANDPNNDYWEGFRQALHTVNPDTYIVGEEWGNASSWLLGDEWDATMNYQYSSAMLSFFRDTPFTDNDHNSGSSAGILTPLDPSELNEHLLNWIERYPPEALYAMMNLLDSHDTNRAVFMLDHNAATGSNDNLLDNPNYDWTDAINRLKGVAILQMTLPGAPTIYYGDEVGTVGPVTYVGDTWQDDPYNRIPYPWLDESGTPFYTFLRSQSNQDNLYNYYALLTAARQNNEALRTGSFDPLLTDDTNSVYAYGRKLADHSSAAVVAVNKTGSTKSATINLDGYLPYGLLLKNIFTNNIYVVNSSGEITVSLPALGGAILVPVTNIAAPPAAVDDLALVAERNGEVDLDWSAASGADSYEIYRSILSGGGYVLVTNTASTSYTDSILQNATDYYYVVVSRNDSNGLVSGYSNEVMGTPQQDLTSAWYNLQWPTEITHTISAITETETIYGQLWIDGLTGGSGPASGISAQIGFGITGSLTTTWTWVDMGYWGIAGSNDEYAGNLLPDMIGDYQYATRWSSDGGQIWYFSDLIGPGDNHDYGMLHVLPSGDSTAPDVPQNLILSGSTASSISLSWDANSEMDLAGYDLYRQPHQATPLNGPGMFKRIARLGSAATSYTDTTVSSGESYDYYLTAFDTSFNFSEASNIITGTAENRMVTVTFRVRVPDHTPGTVYIAGNLPGYPQWNPGAQPMTQVSTSPNLWEIDLSLPDGTSGAMYKYTRGSWEKVEWWGSIISLNNRDLPAIAYGTTGTMLIDNTATDWGTGSDDGKAVQYWRDPYVIAVDPANGMSGVPMTSTVSLEWSQPMPANTEFSISGPSGVVSGTFGYDSLTYTVVFTPTDTLELGTYKVSASGLQDADGDTQQVPFSSTFNVGYVLYMPVVFKE